MKNVLLLQDGSAQLFSCSRVRALRQGGALRLGGALRQGGALHHLTGRKLRQSHASVCGGWQTPSSETNKNPYKIMNPFLGGGMES